MTTQAEGIGRGVPDATPDSTVDVIGLAATMVRRWKLIAASVVLFLLLAIAALTVISPRYAATARILIDPREQRVVQNEVVQQGFGADMALIDSQVEVITSEAVLTRVVEDNGLESDSEFVKTVPEGRTAAEVALEGLAKAIKVTRPDNTYVLEIAVTTKEAAKSARLANAVAEAYTADQASSSASAARNVSSSISDRLNELQTRVRVAEEKVEAFKRDNNVSQPDGQLLVDGRLRDLSQRHSAAIAAATAAKARLDVMEQALKTRGDVSSVVTDPNGTMGVLRTQLSDAKRNLAELEQVLGPLHPRVSAARGQVEQAQSAIGDESRRLVESARDEYKTASDTVSKLEADLKTAQSESFDTNKTLIELRELEREAQSSRLVYESFLVRAKETAEQETITARTARIIAPASIPNSASFPPRLPLLAAAVVLGLAFGVMLAILADTFDRFRGRLFGGRAGNKAELAAAAAQPLAHQGVIMVTALEDPELARQAALEIARNAASAGREAIFLDLGVDAASDLPGLAEMAAGRIKATAAVHVGKRTGLHMLNAGRRDALTAVAPDRVAEVLGALAEEYDDVIANVGSLQGRSGRLVAPFADHAPRAVLAVRGAKLGARERHAVAELTSGGKRSVSVVSVEAGDRLERAA